MADKVGAYGTKASEAGFRKKWDIEAYTAKSKSADLAAYEHHLASEAAVAEGKRPPKPSSSRLGGNGADLPKPTKALEARGFDLEIEKGLNKTVLVAGGSKGGPGYYCELCRRTLKDSIAYLDHVNGRSHLAHLGQTTQVRRSTLQQVRDRIALLRAQTATKVTSKNFDFETRLREAREEEERVRREKKEGRKRKREGGGAAVAPTVGGTVAGGAGPEEKKPRLSTTMTGANATTTTASKGNKGAFGDDQRREAEEAEMAGFMGFGGFGGGVKKR